MAMVRGSCLVLMQTLLRRREQTNVDPCNLMCKSKVGRSIRGSTSALHTSQKGQYYRLLLRGFYQRVLDSLIPTPILRF